MQLTPNQRKVLNLSADYESTEARSTPIDHLLLAWPHPLAEDLRVVVGELVAGGCLRASGDSPNETLRLTSEGLFLSNFGGPASLFAERLLGYFHSRLARDGVKFKGYSWADLKTVHVVEVDDEFPLARTVIDILRLSGGGATAGGPSPHADWKVPSDIVDFRGFTKFTDLVRRVDLRRQQSMGQKKVDSLSNALPRTSESRTMTSPTNKTLSVLFLDLAGWSKLTSPQITAYLEKALPKLADKIKSFRSTHLNTWGDAVVATFSSSVEAANCALDVRDFFRRSAESDGVPRGLVPRISLHVGEVIVANNPLINREDIFGEAVHLAARLEPVTPRGQVFCTEAFATALRSLSGVAPAVHEMGTADLPKGFGRIKYYAVTGANEDAPAAPMVDGSITNSKEPSVVEVPLGDEETAGLLKVMLQTLPARSTSLTYAEVTAKCHARVSRDAIKRVLPKLLTDSNWEATIGEETVALEYHLPGPIVSSRPRRGG